MHRDDAVSSFSIHIINVSFSGSASAIKLLMFWGGQVKQFFARTRKAIEDWFYQTMPIAE